MPPSESDTQSNQCKMQEVLIEIIEIVFTNESALFTAAFKTNKTNLTQFLATAPPDLISWSNVTSLATCLQNVYLIVPSVVPTAAVANEISSLTRECRRRLIEILLCVVTPRRRQHLLLYC